MVHFEILPQSPPWCFVRTLSQSRSERAECVAYVKQMHGLFRMLASTAHALTKELLAARHFRNWSVVKEPLRTIQEVRLGPRRPP